MNREKILFVAVLGIVLLWGGLSLSGTYEPVRKPNPPMERPAAPDLPDFKSLASDERLMQVLVGVRKLGKAESTRSGRGSVHVPHSDLLPVDPAGLELPRALTTPWIGLPVEPFPPVRYLRRLREDHIPPVASKPEETDMEGSEGGAIIDEPAQPDLPTVEDILGAKEKFVFVPEEWDVLFMGHGTLLYGRISLTKESTATGKTKFDLLLTENGELEFFFEQLDKIKGRFISSAPMTIAGSGVESVKFSDTVLNQYKTRRTTSRVRPDDEIALCDLGDWILELAEMEKYDRMTGLELARDSYKEALADKPGYLRAVLGLGEAFHRRFEFDDELGLYQDVMGERSIPEILSRQSRIYRKLGLDDLVVETLGVAIFNVPGDASLRMRRAEAYNRLGKFEEALADFSEAEKIATADDKIAAREGRARVLIAMARPAEAESLVSAAEDAESLVTLGAARYARMNWSGALEAFQRAAELAPENARAMTNLGIARARAATEWADVELALETLTNARELSPLNYFFPPLGQGFAEQRMGDPENEDRQGHYTTSIEHYKTAVEALPGDAYAHYILGRSYLRDGNYEGARNEFKTAYFLDYRLSDALLGAGTAALNLGDYKMARAIFDRFATVENRVRESSKEPAEVRVAKAGAVLGHYRLGRAWLMSDDVSPDVRLEKAREQFRRALELEPMHVPSMNALGFILYNQGDVDKALDQFDRSRRQSKEGDSDFDYAKDAVARIEDTRGRRRWVEGFDRPNSRTIGNGWKQVPDAGVPLSPKLNGGKAVVEGRWERNTKAVWLVRGDPTARGKRATQNLNDKFIRTRAVVDYSPSDSIAMQFLVYYQVGSSPIKVAIGVERNARGEVLIVHKKSSAKKWSETAITNEAGEAKTWPKGPVTLEVIRRDHKKGRFEILMDGESIGNVDLGLKRGGGPLYVGFYWRGASGDTFRTVVEELELEIYE